MLLEVKGITKRFGGLTVLSEIDLNVEDGSILGLIGPNGAGKTTLFNIITGFLRPTCGQVVFEGLDVTGMRPDLLARRGIARSFQNTSVFGERTVMENVIAAHHVQAQCGFLANVFNTPRYQAEERRLRENSLEIIAALDLSSCTHHLAKNLSYGHQRRLEICIALAVRPRLLLLDEPAAGLNDVETRQMLGLIARLRQAGTTVVLIEHNMRAVMSVCDRVCVLNFGNKIAQGTPDEVRGNEQVIEAYLGMEDAVA